MQREPKWTNKTTRETAKFLWELTLQSCKSSATEPEPEPIDWPQVIAWLESQRDALIRERDASRKRKGKAVRK